MEKGCHLGRDTLALRESGEGEGESNKEQWKALGETLHKRWEVLGVCLSKIGDRQVRIPPHVLFYSLSIHAHEYVM